MKHTMNKKHPTLAASHPTAGRLAPLTLMPLAALALLAACAGAPATNPRVEDARNSLRAAQSDPKTQGLAGGELRQATEALAAADAAVAQREDTAAIDHLAYLAQQRVGLLQEAGNRRAAEAAVARANSERDQLRLAARTQEVTAAQNQAAASQLNAMVSQRQAESAQRDAQTSQRSAEGALRDTVTAQRQTELAQQQTGDAERRAAALQAQLTAQLNELNAKKTDRGMVVTIGDVLFDTGQSQIKSGGLRSMDKLVDFMKTYPKRSAVIEGFTDSVGSDDLNQALSARRADAVRAALVGMGVASERLTAKGYGEAFPVAGNENSGGRQMNRRVEIVLSDDGGVVAPR